MNDVFFRLPLSLLNNERAAAGHHPGRRLMTAQPSEHPTPSLQAGPTSIQRQQRGLQSGRKPNKQEGIRLG